MPVWVPSGEGWRAAPRLCRFFGQGSILPAYSRLRFVYARKMKRPVPRDLASTAIRRALAASPVVALLGPRQCGKSTLARQLAAGRPVTFIDLENPSDLALLDQPMQTLTGLRGLVVLDEVQRRPDLFSVLRVLTDRSPLPARFGVLGGASVDLLRVLRVARRSHRVHRPGGLYHRGNRSGQCSPTLAARRLSPFLSRAQRGPDRARLRSGGPQVHGWAVRAVT